MSILQEAWFLVNYNRTVLWRGRSRGGWPGYFCFEPSSLNHFVLSLTLTCLLTSQLLVVAISLGNLQICSKMLLCDIMYIYFSVFLVYISCIPPHKRDFCKKNTQFTADTIRGILYICVVNHHRATTYNTRCRLENLRNVGVAPNSIWHVHHIFLPPIFSLPLDEYKAFTSWYAVWKRCEGHNGVCIEIQMSYVALRINANM